MSQTPPNLEGLRIKRDEPRPGQGRAAIWIGLLLLLVCGAAVWWFVRTGATPVTTVAVRELSASSADRTVLNASGYVTARREATVSSKVTGKVVEIHVEEGMKVTEGQVLARLDDSNVTASLLLARAQADAAKSMLAETRVRLREAEQEFQRQSDLRSRQVAPQADFDRAEAAVLALRARIEQQQADANVAGRTVAVWQQQLDDNTIRAPFAGTVTSKNAQPGEMISPMSTGGFTRTGICTIVDMDSLEIEIDVNESYINRVQPGQAVEATLDAYPDWRIACHVIAIIPTADRGKSTVRVRVGFDKLDPRILPEMSVKVAFHDTAEATAASAARRSIVVPNAAVRHEGDQSVVFVVRNNQAERRAITVSRRDGDTTVVSAGLSPNDRVVTSAPADLADGARVKEVSP